MPSRYILKGNNSLIIFRIFAEHSGLNIFEIFDNLNNRLIEKYSQPFIDKVEKEEIKLPKNSHLHLLYENLKQNSKKNSENFSQEGLE